VNQPYYHAYERRYRTAHEAGAVFWGHTPDDPGLTEALTDWVMINNLAGKRVIEFACGEGASGVILSRLGCIYHGVDVSPTAVERARLTLADCPDATVSRLDMAKWQPDGTYDAALDVMGLHMLVTDPDRAAYLKNALLCLKPGAPMLFFREMHVGDADDGYIGSFDEWQTKTGGDYETPRDLCFQKDGADVEIRLPYVPGRAKTKDGYNRELTAAGFAVESIEVVEPSRNVQDSVAIYARNAVTPKTIGQVSFALMEDFDFSFLAEYGEAFVVFDRQDSGNLCLGMQKDGKRFFLKIAGAATVRSNVTPEEAVGRMKETVPVYQDLRHPKLAELLEHRAIPGGYLQVFAWFDGKCMGMMYDSRERFLALPNGKKLAIYRDILDFHRHVNQRGYVAIDFYDGCILYNFDTQETMFCNIEFYAKMPFVNNMGRLWGSSRYMSPEEFQLGAVIDERSNVFCMGAAAFDLFGGGMDRSREKWGLSDALFSIATQAIIAEREDRYPTIKAYGEAWGEAIEARRP